ncbi:MAG: metal-sulfur cluster assembly factor [Candidatus Nanoarchaeia archaeon]|jgi:metal-sulfur cluster biosynthetic enzyme|nr:metal-sulfur cluster assembly factor [Candidatus Nanoarchaeia archaeon]|tara:strand:+ start:44422 stop:44709 length:288 start_codon:yes stop_codon:yes gene_type:complete
MVSKSDVVDALKKVMDPELHIDIWTLELVYNIEIDEDSVNVLMTFTSPGCPYGPALLADTKQKLSDLDGVKKVNVEVIFEPLWEPSEDLRAMLGV